MKRYARWAKGFVIRLLNLLPVHSAIVGTPRKCITLGEYLLQHSDNTHISIRNSENVKLNPPIINTVSIPEQYARLTYRATPKQSVTVLKNGRVWGLHGAVITADDCLLQDVSREFGLTNPCKQHAVFHNLRLGKPTHYDKGVAVVTTAGASVYYHWMVDIVPRILMLQQTKLQSPDYYVLDYKGLLFQKETLELLGINEQQLIIPNKRQFHIQASELYVPTLASNLNEVNLYEMHLLRKLFYNPAIQSPVQSKRIYVSRGGSNASRGIINEGEVFSFLQTHGFEVVYPEQYSIQEQAAIFAQADIIAGPHGSAFTNIIFSRPDTRLLDILPDTNIVPCFYNMAAQMGIRYAAFVGKGVPVNDSYKNDAIDIDLQAFKTFVEHTILP